MKYASTAAKASATSPGSRVSKAAGKHDSAQSPLLEMLMPARNGKSRAASVSARANSVWVAGGTDEGSEPIVQGTTHTFKHGDRFVSPAGTLRLMPQQAAREIGEPLWRMLRHYHLGDRRPSRSCCPLKTSRCDNGVPAYAHACPLRARAGRFCQPTRNNARDLLKS
jgi:hypothetical protein